MKLIIDTNILIAAFIRDSTMRRIIISGFFEIYALKTNLQELFMYKEYILQKSHITDNEFYTLISSIFQDIKFFGEEDYAMNIEKADFIMSAIDINDSFVIAAALSVDCDGIWSDDKHLKLQKVVPVFNTDDMLKE